jgi:hypothetical protein
LPRREGRRKARPRRCIRREASRRRTRGGRSSVGPTLLTIAFAVRSRAALTSPGDRAPHPDLYGSASEPDDRIRRRPRVPPDDSLTGRGNASLTHKRVPDHVPKSAILTCPNCTQVTVNARSCGKSPANRCFPSRRSRVRASSSASRRPARGGGGTRTPEAGHRNVAEGRV